MLVAGDEVRRTVRRLDLIEQGKVGQPTQDVLEEADQFEPSEVVAQTEVSAEPEGHVLVRRTCDVEAERIVEDGRVAVGGWIEQQQLVAGRELLPAELDV